MFFVYILYSFISDRTYTGLTNNLQRRLSEHRKGKDRGSKIVPDFVVLHTEFFQTKKEAYSKEKYFKSTSGRREIKRMIKEKF